jgi:predicted RNA binding protein YcfA (HicA-like mRNA interferase family)
MTKLPQVSGSETIKALQKIGFNIIHQRGSHVKLTRIIGKRKQTIIVPSHKVIKKGTLRNGILRVLNLSLDDFEKLLKKY